MKFHPTTIDTLAKRLCHTHNYILVHPNIEYDISEIDLFAYRHKANKNYFLFFEVKSKDHPRLRRKAKEQLEKHNSTFGGLADKVYKFYVCPGKTVREDYRVKWIR
jgi:hypothetical protein